MSFEVDADAYGQFIGRYSETLASRFADLVDVQAGARVLDVGCGPGALASELARRAGSSAVVAIDPSESFVAATRERLPDVAVHRSSAEQLLFLDDTFDLALAQLVVHFMSDPVAGIREMARVTRPGGTVAACVWDHAGGRGPVSLFWRAVLDLDPAAPDESELAGARDGHLVELFAQAGLDATQTTLTVSSPFAGADEWWQSFQHGVGPAGAYVAQLDSDHREALRDHCIDLLPAGSFTIDANAWAATARV